MGNRLSNNKYQGEPLVESPVLPFYDLWKDEYRSKLLLAANLYDEGSPLQRLPYEIVKEIVLLEQHERRVLSRSHYRICRAIAVSDFDWGYRRSCPGTYQPHDFSVDLVTAASAVIDFLLQVKRISEFDKKSFAHAQVTNYLKFLYYQNRTDEELVPSLEVQAVWFSHMLQSCPYRLFMDRHYPRVSRLNHPIVRGLDKDKLKELQDRTSKLLDQNTLGQNFDLASVWGALNADFTPEMVIYDRDWIVEFAKFTYATNVHSLSFLEKAHLGYQKFIHLKGTRNPEVENIGFSPCPSIDLIWHTHLLHPLAYEQDLRKLIGHVPKHKLLDLTDRNSVFMNTRDDKSLNLWDEVFLESIFDYATA